MSGKAFEFRSREQWDNWTRGPKNANGRHLYWGDLDRRDGRRVVRRLKRLSAQAQRRLSKRTCAAEVANWRSSSEGSK